MLWKSCKDCLALVAATFYVFIKNLHKKIYISPFFMTVTQGRSHRRSRGGVRHPPVFARFVGKTRAKQKKGIERTRLVSKFIENGR